MTNVVYCHAYRCSAPVSGVIRPPASSPLSDALAQVQMENQKMDESNETIKKLEWIYKKAKITKYCVLVQAVLAVILFVIVYFKLYK